MKTIIAGTQEITDYTAVLEAIMESHFTITEVVSGDCAGVDRLGERWAKRNNIPIKQFKPDWKLFRGQAGIVRNGQMAAYADQLIAVWNGYSPGTGNMIRRMTSLGKAVHVHTKFKGGDEPS